MSFEQAISMKRALYKFGIIIIIIIIIIIMSDTILIIFFSSHGFVFLLFITAPLTKICISTFPSKCVKARDYYKCKITIWLKPRNCIWLQDLGFQDDLVMGTSSHRYSCAMLLIALKGVSKILKSMRCLTGSQCSFWRNLNSLKTIDVTIRYDIWQGVTNSIYEMKQRHGL